MLIPGSGTALFVSPSGDLYQLSRAKSGIVQEYGRSHPEQPTCLHIDLKITPVQTASPDHCCLPGPDIAHPSPRSAHGYIIIGCQITVRKTSPQPKSLPILLPTINFSNVQTADVVVGLDNVGLAGAGAGGFEHVRVDGALGQVYRNPSTGNLHLSIP